MELDEAIKSIQETINFVEDNMPPELPSGVDPVFERRYVPIHVHPGDLEALRALVAAAEAGRWRPIETAPKGEEVLIAYWRWRNSMSPGSVVVQSAMQTEYHGPGIWSWVVSDNKHGPFPIRGWSNGDMIGWRPIVASLLSETAPPQRAPHPSRLAAPEPR